MKTLILLSFLSIIFFSCEKTINIEIPDEGRKLTVNSFLRKDSILKINLTRSRYILDGENNFTPVKEADILILVNGEQKKLKEAENGNYFSDFILQAESKYEIRIKSKDFPELYASTTVPLPAIINKSSVILLDKESFELGFTIEFEDNADTEDAYMIEVYEWFLFYPEDLDIDSLPLVSQIQLFPTQELELLNDPYWTFVVTDDLFNGKRTQIKFRGLAQYRNIPEHGMFTKYFIKLKTLSKEYYLYLISNNKAQTYDEVSFFKEPVQVYTNIENGFGIFAGVSMDVDSIKVEPAL